MTAASNSESRKRLAAVPEQVDGLVLIHEFETAVRGHNPLTRAAALDALLVRMGETPLYGATR